MMMHSVFVLSYILFLVFLASLVTSAPSLSPFTSTWSKPTLLSSSRPGALCDASSAYDPISQSKVIFGGYDENAQLKDKLWYLDASLDNQIAWLEQPYLPSSPIPAARYGSSVFVLTQPTNAAAYAQVLVSHGNAQADPSNSSLYTPLDDTWLLNMNLHTWTTAASASASASTLSMRVSRQTNLSDSTWTDMSTMGSQPPPRQHALLMGVSNTSSAFASRYTPTHLLLFGGEDTLGSDMNDLWLLDVTAAVPVWQNITDQMTGVIPPPVSGHRGAVIQKKLYIFGGYICTQSSSQSSGGSGCFLDGIYVLDVDFQSSTFLRWSIIPSSTDPAIYWPVARAFHSLDAFSERYLILFGGTFVDSSASRYWYNTVEMFDTETKTWTLLSVRGRAPSIMSHHTAQIAWSSSNAPLLYIYGGCTSGFTNDNVYILRIGERIRASNCSVSGPGSQAIIAGQLTYLMIETRARARDTTNNSFTDSLLTWGEGLQFDVYAIGQNLRTGIGGRLDLEVEELGAGRYNVTFVASKGSSDGCITQYTNISLYVLLDDEHVPGSPFTIPVFPSTFTANMTVVQGEQISVKEKNVNFTIIPQDRFGNAARAQLKYKADFTLHSARSTLAAAQGANASVASSSELSSLYIPPSKTDFSILVDNSLISSKIDTYTAANQLSFIASYVAPARPYKLEVLYKNKHVLGSPFQITPVDNLDIPAKYYLTFEILAYFFIAIWAVWLLAFLLLGRSSPFLPKSLPIFSRMNVYFFLLIFVGAILGLLSISVSSPRPYTDSSCLSFQWLLGFGFSFSFAGIWLRILHIGWYLRGIEATASGHSRTQSDSNIAVKLTENHLHSTPPLRYTIFISVFLCSELLFNLLWTFLDPVQATTRISTSNKAVSFVLCDCQGSILAWHAATFFSKAILVFYSVRMAAKVRGMSVKEERWNELNAIGIVVNNIALVGVVLVPLVYFQALEQNPTTLYVLKSLIILWCFVFTPSVLLLPPLMKSKAIYSLATSSSHESSIKTASPRVVDPSAVPKTGTGNDSNGQVIVTANQNTNSKPVSFHTSKKSTRLTVPLPSGAGQSTNSITGSPILSGWVGGNLGENDMHKRKNPNRTTS